MLAALERFFTTTTRAFRELVIVAGQGDSGHGVLSGQMTENCRDSYCDDNAL